MDQQEHGDEPFGELEADVVYSQSHPWRKLAEEAVRAGCRVSVTDRWVGPNWHTRVSIKAPLQAKETDHA